MSKNRTFKDVDPEKIAMYLSGAIIGNSEVLGPVGRDLSDNYVYWEVKCGCGRIRVVREVLLKKGRSAACSSCSAKASKHGITRNGQSSVEYATWCGIRKRCLSGKAHNFQNYGGKGILMCDGWRENAERFISDIGQRPSSDHSIDRIDNTKHYSCGSCDQCIREKWTMNVRWATAVQQSRNRSSNVVLTVNGVSKTVAEWSEVFAIPRHAIYSRKKRGWTDELAVTTPLQVQFSHASERIE